MRNVLNPFTDLLCRMRVSGQGHDLWKVRSDIQVYIESNVHSRYDCVFVCVICDEPQFDLGMYSDPGVITEPSMVPGAGCWGALRRASWFRLAQPSGLQKKGDCRKKACVVYVDGSFRRGAYSGGAGAFVSVEHAWGGQFLARATSSLECELHAIRLALELAQSHAKLIIRSDSQMAIALASDIDRLVPRNVVVMPQFRTILTAIRVCMAQCANVEFEWVRGHADSVGNDMADRIARTVMRGYVNRINLKVIEQTCKVIVEDFTARSGRVLPLYFPS